MDGEPVLEDGPDCSSYWAVEADANGQIGRPVRLDELVHSSRPHTAIVPLLGRASAKLLAHIFQLPTLGAK
eukprot:8284722-Lingulodinium_polyedra.AAC.1